MKLDNAFEKLDVELKKQLLLRVHERCARYQRLIREHKYDRQANTLIVGDRPAPDAPNDPNFHFTPFGAPRNSSLWLNLQLHHGQIPEAKLTWLNAIDFRGQFTDYSYLEDNEWHAIVALGGTAASWLRHAPSSHPFDQVYHPAAWKRFHCKKDYPLIELLQSKI